MSAFPKFRKNAKGGKDRKGGVPPVLPAASSSAPEIGTSVIGAAEQAASSASSSASGVFEALGTLFGKVGQSTGISTLLATKAGVVAFVLTGTTLAAGLSLFMGGGSDPASQRLSAPGQVFSGAGAAPDSASSQVYAPAAPSPAGGTSLDYAPSAREPAPQPDAPAAAAADAVSDAPSAAPSDGAVASGSGAPAAAGVKPGAAPTPKPKFLAAGSIAGAASAGGATTAFKPVDSVGGKVGSGFQDIYKPGRTTGLSGRGTRANVMASRRAVPSKVNSALGQARKASALSRSAASLPSSNAASATASKAFDGVNTGAGAGVPGAGVGDGAKGLSVGDNNAAQNKQVEPPAPPSTGEKKNKTPYQNLIYAGIGALMLGTVLLMFAAQMIKSGNFPMAKMLALGAAACGGAAAGIGGILAAKWGQMTQGLPFMMGGGLLAAQAIKVMMEADKAAQDAEKGCKDADSQAKGTSDSKLQSKCPGGNCGGSSGGGASDSGGGGDASSAMQGLSGLANQGAQNNPGSTKKQDQAKPTGVTRVSQPNYTGQLPDG